MKTKVLLFLVLLSLLSCSVNTSDNIDIDAKDIQYTKDERTGLCFGFIASRETASFTTTGLGMTEVPCSALP